MLIPIDAITVGPRRRKLQRKALKELVSSIGIIGLRTPVTVRPGKEPGQFLLIAGWHRLEACRKLGRTEIEAELQAASGDHARDKLDAGLWEAAENLHRAELTVLEKNLWKGRWVQWVAEKLKQDQRERSASEAEKGLSGQRKSAITRAAGMLGIPERTAQRAVRLTKHLTKPAQAEAIRLGLDTNQRALEKAVEASPAPEHQIKSLRHTAEKLAETARWQAISNGTLEPPLSGQAAFDRWYWSLDIDIRAKVRIWLLGVDLEAWFGEQDELAKLMAADRAALH